jgi:uncharacterized protein (TIGR00297 family)
MLHALFSVGVAVVAGALGYQRHMLTWSGWLAASLFGGSVLAFGGWSWAFTLGVSFGITALLARYGARLVDEAKRSEPRDTKCRDFWQVLSSGSLPALVALLYALTGSAPQWVAVFIGMLACVAGDTWSSEIGSLGPGQPRCITTGERVPHGTPGAITWFGVTLAAVAGLLVAGLFSSCAWLVQTLLSVHQPSSSVFFVVAPSAGVAGMLMDSFLNTVIPHPDPTTSAKYAQQHRIISNTVNLLSSLVAGCIALALYWLLT